MVGLLSEDAIEAAARELADRLWPEDFAYPGWMDAHPEDQEEFRDAARAALSAALSESAEVKW